VFAGQPTSFFVGGGGGADLDPLLIDEAERGPYAARVYGFSDLEVTPETLTLRHLDEKGQLIHSFTKKVDGTVRVVG